MESIELKILEELKNVSTGDFRSLAKLQCLTIEDERERIKVLKRIDEIFPETADELVEKVSRLILLSQKIRSSSVVRADTYLDNVQNMAGVVQIFLDIRIRNLIKQIEGHPTYKLQTKESS